MLECLLPQLSLLHDEVLIIGDGPQPNARGIVDQLKSPIIQYWEHGPIWNYGNPQRNLAMARAKGSHIMFVDDDDLPTLDAIRTVKEAVVVNRGRPIVFRMKHLDRLIWETREVKLGNLGGQMFIAPNTKERLGRWSGKYSADFDYVESTLKHYPEGPVWREELILIQGVGGVGTIGHEIP